MARSPLRIARAVDDFVLVITIDRQDRHNAFDSATSRAMESILDEYDSDNELRCAIITGAGGTFSAGADLIAVGEGDWPVAEGRGLFGIFERPPVKPIIAAVEGHALAGGLELCLACDLVVAADDVVMGLPEATRSLVAIGGGLFRLPRRIPYHVAMELALTGRTITAAEMHSYGFVNRLTERGKALDGALDLAAEIAAAGPLATIASKEVIRSSATWSDEMAWKLQEEFTLPVQESEDFQEGLRAFAEKRDPVWRGR